jgi:hypothetical protein
MTKAIAASAFLTLRVRAILRRNAVCVAIACEVSHRLIRHGRKRKQRNKD